MYKALIRPVLTYASETWTLSKANERWLGLFERKVLDAFLERNKRNEDGGKVIIMNYMIYLTIQISSITSKLKVWH
jgi:hypothetical protein